MAKAASKPARELHRFFSMRRTGGNFQVLELEVDIANMEVVSVFEHEPALRMSAENDMKRGIVERVWDKLDA